LSKDLALNVIVVIDNLTCFLQEIEHK